MNVAYDFVLTAILSFALGAIVMDIAKDHQQGAKIEAEGAAEQRLVCWHREVRSYSTAACL